MGEATRGDLQPERGPQQVRDLRQRHPHLGVQLDHQRHDRGAELHARRPQRVGGLQRVPALHPPLTPRAVADLDGEAPHNRAHHGQVFLILRRLASHCDRAAAVRTFPRNRRRVGLVDLRRARPAAVEAILHTGSPSGTPAETLRPVLRERCGLAATRPTCLVQLPLQALHLFLQAVILTLQSVALALQPALLAPQVLGVALPPRQLSAKAFEVGGKFRSPMRERFPVGGRHATVMPQSEKLYKSKY